MSYRLYCTADPRALGIETDAGWDMAAFRRHMEVCQECRCALAATLSRPGRPPHPGERRVRKSIFVRPSVWAALEELARADDRTISYLAEKAALDYIERHKK